MCVCVSLWAVGFACYSDDDESHGYGKYFVQIRLHFKIGDAHRYVVCMWYIYGGRFWFVCDRRKGKTFPMALAEYLRSDWFVVSEMIYHCVMLNSTQPNSQWLIKSAFSIPNDFRYRRTWSSALLTFCCYMRPFALSRCRALLSPLLSHFCILTLFRSLWLV